MEIHELKDLNGNKTKYHGLDTAVKPKEGMLIRILEIFEGKGNLIVINNPLLLEDLSTDKVYEVRKVLDTYRVRIRNDKGITVDLSKSLFQIVKKVSDKEIKDFLNTKKILSNFDRILKK
ncbi:hypothetical protein [Pseudogracilibacillus auburnensis]|uniref:hypothetical protein n=1 Tax=Pseudogracilibacillus auburnensis TaxID=1494959 RepID=UPI001A96E10E|nr:hypothetical protein [Pseudogracilibacillus auburnensis]MBO1003163.1 hypothetical protein [Pseudogracilibacillus auburnensis]